jgi:ATP-dependent phosphofructokinase / diphosphate-dependent phosphofructokinase
MAMGLVEVGTHGVMVGHREGALMYTDIPGKNLQARRVNPADYNTDRYRANFEHTTGPYRPQG